MKLAVITRPEFFEGETGLVNALFMHGLERLHLRKPGSSKEVLAEWIGGIEPGFRKRIVLHDHHDLARDLGLGGIHLNGRNPEVPGWLDRGIFSVSRSCHSIREVRDNLGQCDYLFLSPVFDSISKEGYGGAFAPSGLRKAAEEDLLAGKVYALGGVSTGNLKAVKELGFHGAAVLGGLWGYADKGPELFAGKLEEFLRLCR
ncbi:MAG: thiamine phosphate synthase [Candidatus Cryptobacteroides sp.]